MHNVYKYKMQLYYRIRILINIFFKSNIYFLSLYFISVFISLLSYIYYYRLILIFNSFFLIRFNI